MDQYLTKVEFDSTIRRLDDVRDKEFRRIDEENDRQNHRLAILEEKMHETHKMLVSIEKMASHMESIDVELHKQGKRLEVLEKRDGEMWRLVIKYILIGIVGVLVGFVASHIGF